MNKKITPINIAHEQRYISYIIKINPEEAFYFDKDVFTDPSLSAIWKACRNLLEENVPLTIENIASESQKFDGRITKENIKAIIEDHQDFTAPEYIRNLVKGNYIKNKYSKIILNELLVDLTDNNELDVDKVDKMAIDLSEEIQSLYSKENDLMTAEDLVNKYSEIIDKRKEGQLKRTLGSTLLDKIIERPGAEGQITTIAALSGGLKSLFVLSLINRAINVKVPVLFISPEMTYEQNTDRLMAIRGKIPVNEIINIDEQSLIRRKLRSTLDEFSEFKNFIMTDKGGLSIKDVERRIIRTKTKFRNLGIFQNGDEYILVVIDLLSMLSNFSGATPQAIENNLNLLLEIAKAHGIHIIGIIQANEGQLRENRKPFESPGEVDNFKIGVGDIKHGSAWRERSRVMITLTRPLEMKKLYFPQQMDDWNLQKDIIKCHVLKQNEGGLGFCQFVFDPITLAIVPYIKEEDFE